MLRAITDEKIVAVVVVVSDMTTGLLATQTSAGLTIGETIKTNKPRYVC